MESMFLWKNTPGLCEEIPTLEYYPAKEKKTKKELFRKDKTPEQNQE